jgi:hypothetical protein
MPRADADKLIASMRGLPSTDFRPTGADELPRTVPSDPSAAEQEREVQEAQRRADARVAEAKAEIAGRSLVETIKNYLVAAGYEQVEPGVYGVWRSPDGVVGKLLPMMVDCFEREADTDS